jgi:hypothetical protein
MLIYIIIMLSLCLAVNLLALKITAANMPQVQQL